MLVRGEVAGFSNEGVRMNQNVTMVYRGTVKEGSLVLDEI